MAGEDNNSAVLKAKIEWYREVLLLEPNSRIFLPFARYLAEVGFSENSSDLLNESFGVLRRGLLLHPDFMEARLFHIELLNSCDCRSQCGAEVARLASLFLSYPDFWDAWREHSIVENESSDFTVALAFMGAILKDKTLSIVEVLEAGLASLRSPLASSKRAFDMEIKPCDDLVDAFENDTETASVSATFNGDTSKMPSSLKMNAQKQNSEGNKASRAEESDIPAKDNPKEAQKSGDEDNIFPESHIENYISYTQKHEEKAQSTKETLANLLADTSIVIEPLENSPFRTRSMAEVLSEQGDLKGAIAIYKELIAESAEPEVLSLKNRLTELENLTARLKNSPEEVAELLAIDDLVDTSFGLLAQKPIEEQNSNEFDVEGMPEEQGEVVAKSTDNIVDLLGKLAERLEAKAS